MILENREKQPFIHFGFNRQTIETHIGIPVTLWQDTLYKVDEISEPFVQAPSSITTKKSLNQYELKFTTLGTKNCQFTTITEGSKILESNEIIVEVVAITWGSQDIFFNNENITFNSL